MTSPEDQSPAPQPPVPESKDRIYRSPAGIAGGVLLLGLVGWIGIDAIVAGDGRTPWLALATLILLVPLIVAFTLRPAVFASEDRLRVRNPLRVIVLPWGQVASLRAGYSNEVVATSGTKYQLWSIPVSLRARNKAARRESRIAAERAGERQGRSGRGAGGLGGFGGFGGGASPRAGAGAGVPDGPVRAESDKIMHELRELWETRQKEESAQGEVTVRWAWEIMGPALAGAVVLGILLAVG
ncbi:PH domain-containing protein [Streptomyces aurantiogriseus]|uniref:Membrane protein n=1 Tax=Streptomyces aurantiogriseus TaxID=66870 RepID=A0A918C0S8_9ACTN|nr:PH domain-containing protein [Streptomyces aurantiogriseus]GGR01424.1 membrane protein [Streptomyces aurantiogriseus]